MSPAAALGRLALRAIPLAGIVFYWLVAGLSIPGGDGYQYWAADPLDPYRGARLGDFGYLYSPAFAQVLWPLKLLPWEAFKLLWTGAELAALVWLAGPWVSLFLLLGQFPLLLVELNQANANLILAAAVWAGYRYPPAWSVALLTKVTPGVGVLWFAFAGQWRRFGIALGATAVVVILSFAIAPRAWGDWLAVIQDSASRSADMAITPLWLRLGVALAIVAWGGLTGRYWTCAAAAILAHPAMSTIGWLIALGAIRHLRPVMQADAAGSVTTSPGRQWLPLPAWMRSQGDRWR